MRSACRKTWTRTNVSTAEFCEDGVGVGDVCVWSADLWAMHACVEMGAWALWWGMCVCLGKGCCGDEYVRKLSMGVLGFFSSASGRVCLQGV